MQLRDVNTTDIGDSIRLGCQAMSRAFNADDADIPYGGAQVRPEAFLGGSMEGHMPGRLLNAMLVAEDAMGLDLDEEVIDKHARAAFFSYSRAPLPLQRIGQHSNGEGDPIELQEHNLREGFHALYALTAFRKSERAMELAAASIDLLFDYWVPNEQWDRVRLERDTPVCLRDSGEGTFIQGPARAIGPLVKLYQATGYQPALDLATVLKDKAVREFFLDDGSTERFGSHVHSTTCAMSSLAQLAECTGDAGLMERVKRFYDGGLWDLRDQIGWSIEVSSRPTLCRRGEANNTGDIIETALILGRWGHPEYYADAERMLRSHLLPSQLRDVSFIVEPDNPEGVDGKRASGAQAARRLWVSGSLRARAAGHLGVEQAAHWLQYRYCRRVRRLAGCGVQGCGAQRWSGALGRYAVRLRDGCPRRAVALYASALSGQSQAAGSTARASAALARWRPIQGRGCRTADLVRRLCGDRAAARGTLDRLCV